MLVIKRCYRHYCCTNVGVIVGVRLCVLACGVVYVRFYCDVVGCGSVVLVVGVSGCCCWLLLLVVAFVVVACGLRCGCGRL